MCIRDSFDIQGIERILPHRYPFLMVDRVLDLVPGESVTAIKNVTINEPYFTGHFPQRKVMPGVMIIEALAQAGGLLLLNTVENPQQKLVLFTGLDNVRWRKQITPGDQIRLHVKMIQFRLSICKMRATAYVNDDIAVEAEMMASITDY